NDVTIATTGLLSSALLSLNNDTTSAQTLKVVGSGSITDNGGGVHTITTKTYQNNTGGNLGTHGIGPFASMNAQVLQFLSLVSANSNCAFTNNSTNLILTCSNPASITSVNSQTGPSITITRQPSYTTITNSTNNIKVGIDAAGVMELNGTQTATGGKTFSGGITMSASNIDLGTNQITRSGHYTVLDLTSGTLLHTNGTFTGTHSSGSIGSAVTVTSLSNAGHVSTFPLTTGTLCQTNMTTTCGTNSGVTSITGTAHNVTASASTGAVTLNTGDGVVQTGLSAQTVTKPIKLNQLNASSSLVDNNDNTKKLTWLLSGMTTGKTLTIRSNQTTSQGLNIPDISNTDTVDLLGLSQSITGTKTLTSSNNNFTSQFYIDHSIYKNDQGGSIELGGSGKNPVTNGEPYIDWHFGNGKA